MSALPREFMLPGRTTCGRGCLQQLLPMCGEFGKRGIVVHGKTLERKGIIERILAGKPADLTVAAWRHAGGEPTLSDVEKLRDEAGRGRAQWIAGIGGGSVIDLAKTAAGLVNAAREVEAYHDGTPLDREGIPFIAAPTTAGTGSEATIVAVLTNDRTNVKKSIRHPSFMPRAVLLDPELLATCPPGVIAASGMDALTQAVESYVSKGATWFSDALALKGLSLVALNLETVFEGKGGAAADELLIGSFITGIALSAARLGLVHGVAHPLGARYHVPHGVVCAVCLPLVVEFNRDAMGSKYAAMSEATGKDLLAAIRDFLATFDIRSPFAGKPIEGVESIVEETLASGSTAANPRPVSAEDVRSLLRSLETG